MSDLLDEKYAVQLDILYLHSHDGKPLRELYPAWGANYKQEFTIYAKEYMHGAGESEKNCDFLLCTAAGLPITHTYSVWNSQIIQNAPLDFTKQID